jgi:predicted RNA binding protein YcfA (HicA-like mRNA interferase family)
LIQPTKKINKIKKVTFLLLLIAYQVAFLLLGHMKVNELLKILRDNGWIKKDQKGSHLQLIHPEKTGKVTVPIHGGDVPIGTLNSILKQAGLK